MKIEYNAILVNCWLMQGNPTMSQSLDRDPIVNVIYGGIKRGIEVCLENECWDSAVILTYSGIDTMAHLSIPNKKRIPMSRQMILSYGVIGICDFRKIKQLLEKSFTVLAAPCFTLTGYARKKHEAAIAEC